MKGDRVHYSTEAGSSPPYNPGPCEYITLRGVVVFLECHLG